MCLGDQAPVNVRFPGDGPDCEKKIMKGLAKYILLSMLGIMGVGCIEEIDPAGSSGEFESILVVDAFLTDRVAVQSVFLSKSFEFDSVPQPERNAKVSLLGDQGAEYQFQEGLPGTYTSTSMLNLRPGERYQLLIQASDGTRYTSDFVKLPEPIAIHSLKAERRLSDLGRDGVVILLDHDTRSSDPAFFRYEYEETYKIVAPFPNPFEWDEVDYDINDGDGWEVTIRAREEESTTCYATQGSSSIILATTAGTSNAGLKDFEVRFLGRENPIIAHRYSVLVKQYRHDVNANSFFTTLQEFSDFDNVFTNIQTGPLEGNIRADNSGTTVLGYFELSSYSELRMFFDYEDFFPNEPLPPYFTNCATGSPALYPEGFHFTPAPDGNGFIIDGNGNSPLIEGILSGRYAYYAENEDYEEWLATEGLGGAAPFLVKPTPCVDCREFGSASVPEYWLE